MISARSEIQADPAAPRAISRPWLFVLGAVSAIAVMVIGAPDLDAPWILGDEHLFIVNNPDVTGAGESAPTGFRPLDIFLHTHEDLYQPITILTYMIQWNVGGDNRVTHIRLTDVIIHAVNAWLLWAVLAALLSRTCPEARGRTLILAWSLALLWALHPMLSPAFAADMGRTHLLAATFVLLSLLLHMKHLDALREPDASAAAWAWFAGAYLMLLAAMLNKPVVGWVLIVFTLEWIVLGLQATLRSARIYLIGVTCACFAFLTLWTTRDTFALDEAALPIFGDPITRSTLGLWIYLRNFMAPLHWLSPWYPPDINTGWSHPAVLAGAGLLILGAAAAIWTARNARLRGITLGLIWFAAAWLPISGLVGARVLAAQDRYMYLPIAGLLLAIGVGLTHWIMKTPATVRLKNGVVLVVAAASAAAVLPWDRTLCATARSSLRRAETTAAHFPNDPRVIEFLAATYDFCRDHECPAAPADPGRYADLTATTMRSAAETASAHPQYFPDERSRAEFHRRLSFNFWKLDMFADSLEQAEQARLFEPDAKMTWVRLAHGYRSLRRWPEALEAYDKLHEIIADDAPDRGLRLVEHADLLMTRFDDPKRALPLFREALMLEGLQPEALRIAMLGAARCEVLVGHGRDGYNLAMQVFQAEPNNVEAAKIVAQYFLRSHEWKKAKVAYQGILSQYPIDYEALRGFQNVCLNSGAWADAAFAWQSAHERDPDNHIFHSHFIWSAACAGDLSAGIWADDLLSITPDNRLACLTHMLLELREGDVEAACEWIERAAAGPPLPFARELVRAEATLRKMFEREELGAEANIARAAIWKCLDEPKRVREILDEYLKTGPDSRWGGVIKKIMPPESPVKTNPTP